MSNFLIFKAAFNGSATPAIGTYTAEGATAQFNKDTSISPDYYLYNTVLYSAVQWFIPTAETTDFEFAADILTRYWDNRITYFIIADSTGTTRLRMWSVNDNWHFENSDSITTSGTEYIGTIMPSASGGFGVFHQFRVRVRKLTESSSSVEVYVDGTLKLTATAGAALITCAKIGFVGGVNSFGPGKGAGIKNAYVYDLSGGDVIDRGVLSEAFNRFINWMKSKFALKSDIPTVNNGTLTIQKNGANVQTFTANQSTAATANITVPTKTSDLTNDSGFITSDNTKIPLAGSNQISGSLIPETTDAYDLGGTSYQWNQAYIKSLTINGVACGDILTHNASEFVDVTTAQTIAGVKTFSSSPRVTKTFPEIGLSISDCDVTETPTQAKFASLYFRDKNNIPLSYIVSQQRTDGKKRMCLRTHRTDNINNYYSVNLDSGGDFYPEQNNTINLGTSVLKWKSLNGINPGALSLPSTYVNVDTTNWVLDGSNVNIFTPASDGWLGIQATDTVYDQMHYVFVGRTGDSSAYYQQNLMSSVSALWDNEYHGCIFIPVIKNINYDIRCICSSITATFYPCQGNV